LYGIDIGGMQRSIAARGKPRKHRDPRPVSRTACLPRPRAKSPGGRSCGGTRTRCIRGRRVDGRGGDSHTPRQGGRHAPDNARWRCHRRTAVGMLPAAPTVAPGHREGGQHVVPEAGHPAVEGREAEPQADGRGRRGLPRHPGAAHPATTCYPAPTNNAGPPAPGHRPPTSG
jgi:hypothetical protein